MSKTNIGRRIKQARLSRGMTQEMLAKEIGTSQTYVSMFERGEVEPSGSWLGSLSSALGVDFTQPEEQNHREAGADWLASRLEDVTGVPSGFWLSVSRDPRAVKHVE